MNEQVGSAGQAGRGKGSRVIPEWVLAGLRLCEDVIYLAVAVALIAVSGALLYHSVADALSSGDRFVIAVTTAVNGVLFVVIVLELFRTVLAHLEGGGFQLRPFLIIGIISSVRHILLIGAQSLATESTRTFEHSQIELGVNAAVALALVIALTLANRGASSNDLD